MRHTSPTTWTVRSVSNNHCTIIMNRLPLVFTWLHITAWRSLSLQGLTVLPIKDKFLTEWTNVRCQFHLLHLCKNRCSNCSCNRNSQYWTVRSNSFHSPPEIRSTTLRSISNNHSTIVARRTSVLQYYSHYLWFHIRLLNTIIIISKLLKRQSKAKCWVPAYSRAVHQIREVVQKFKVGLSLVARGSEE